MSDLSTKKDPLHLRHEHPDYVEDKSGEVDEEGNDLSETVPPSVGTDPQSTGSTDVHKPVVHLDPTAVKKAEAEGKGYDT